MCLRQHLGQMLGERRDAGTIFSRLGADNGLAGPNQEPGRHALDQPQGGTEEFELNRRRDFIVERVDVGPQRIKIEDLAQDHVSARNIARTFASARANLTHEGDAGPVDQIIGRDGRDQLTPQPVRFDGLAKARNQKLREISEKIFFELRIVGKIARDQLFRERVLDVGEQHRQLGPRERLTDLGTRHECVLARQELDPAVELAAFFEIADESRLRVEPFRAMRLGQGQREALEVVVAQDKIRDIVGHLLQQRVPVRQAQCTRRHHRVEQDLEVYLVVGGVDPCRIVDGVGVYAPALQRVFDPPKLGDAKIGAFTDNLGADLRPVNPQRVVGLVAGIGMALA
jgi:hypothetical protein